MEMLRSRIGHQSAYGWRDLTPNSAIDEITKKDEN